MVAKLVIIPYLLASIAPCLGGFAYFFNTNIPAFTEGFGFFHLTHKVPAGYAGPVQAPPFPLPRYGCVNELNQLVICPTQSVIQETPEVKGTVEPIDGDDYDYINPRDQGPAEDQIGRETSQVEEIVDKYDTDFGDYV